MNRPKAFTLIELLIVVAIIAILAAIAVPNFLEAQTRSKVSRTINDFRTIKTALESYRIDNNIYPETDLGATQLSQRGVGLFRVTTPVAFLTSVPTSPFDENKIGAPAGQPKNANRLGIYLYVRAQRARDSDAQVGNSGVDANYALDRLVYLYPPPSPIASPPVGLLGILGPGEYLIKSVGPDGRDDRDQQQLGAGETAALARVYDPTNGTISAGDIVTWQDTSIPAEPRQFPQF